jgi:DNA ligase (NAD+)
MANSVTQKVGFEVKSKLVKVTHKTPLKSLNKTKSVDDLIKFYKGKDCLLEFKNDGLTNEIIFNEGILQSGSTRGDSVTGELITHNIRTYKNLPKQISFKGLLRISGEAIIKYDEFDKINSKLAEEDKYKTPRNLCAGSVRQLDSKVCSDRNINFLIFGLLEAEDMEFGTKDEQFIWLRSLGFEITPYYVVSKDDIENNRLPNMIEELKALAKEQYVPIDGEVLTYNSIKYSNGLQETNHHPLHSIALKFFDISETTEYLYTNWNTTRTGMISCTGVFKPVILDNTSVSRASLYNIDMFEELKLGVGDSVDIVKRNQIIPKIINNSTRSNTETIIKHCPCCGGDTEIRIKEKTRFLYCTNDECDAKLSKIICHYCSKPAMNIDGVSTATIQVFMDKGIIENMVDLYKLENKKFEILKLPKFGIKKYNN